MWTPFTILVAPANTAMTEDVSPLAQRLVLSAVKLFHKDKELKRHSQARSPTHLLKKILRQMAKNPA